MKRKVVRSVNTRIIILKILNKIIIYVNIIITHKLKPKDNSINSIRVYFNWHLIARNNRYPGTKKNVSKANGLNQRQSTKFMTITAQKNRENIR